MSFLDSLENNLKSLEGTETSGLDEHKRKQSERQRAIAAGPWADKLKNSPYTQMLLQQATRAGYQIRTKVNFVWLNGTLRLEARGHRLELRPTPEGILAVQLKGTDETRRDLIDLSGSPETLLESWIPILARQKKEDDEAVAKAAIEDEE